LIEQLFGSKTRVKLLSLFLSNPDRPFYVREITRKIDEQINSVRRELSNLLSIGIIKSDSNPNQNKLYYEVNQKYVYFNELRKMFAEMPIKSKALQETKEEDLIAKKLRSTGQVDMAFLTGMFVRQSHVGIDIFIVGDVNRAKVSKVVSELEQEQGRELNYTVMTPEEYSYRANLNDRFLSNIMEAKKIKVIDASDQTSGEKDPDIEHREIEIEPGGTPVPVKLDAGGGD
jgi:predicted transcriptional regulator